MEDHSAPQQLDAEGVVKRYEVYAEIMGRQRDRKDKNDSDEHPVYKQAAFSLLWFYRNLAQPVRTDVRPLQIADLRRGSRLHKSIQDKGRREQIAEPFHRVVCF